jgi:hypothetical protein
MTASQAASCSLVASKKHSFSSWPYDCAWTGMATAIAAKTVAIRRFIVWFGLAGQRRQAV